MSDGRLWHPRGQRGSLRELVGAGTEPIRISIILMLTGNPDSALLAGGVEGVEVVGNIGTIRLQSGVRVLGGVKLLYWIC